MKAQMRTDMEMRPDTGLRTNAGMSVDARLRTNTGMGADARLRTNAGMGVMPEAEIGVSAFLMRSESSYSHRSAADSASRRRSRLQKRKRMIRRRCCVLFTTVCLVLLCAVSYRSIASNASTGTKDVRFKYYTNITVESGDTLWTIADAYIDYDEYANKSAYIDEVCRINHLDEKGTLLAGQKLYVPYYSDIFVE